jgi:hypothetical protein
MITEMVEGSAFSQAHSDNAWEATLANSDNRGSGLSAVMIRHYAVDRSNPKLLLVFIALKPFNTISSMHTDRRSAARVRSVIAAERPTHLFHLGNFPRCQR